MLDYDNLIFNIDIESPRPHPGALLVAEPFMVDAYFRHSVVCIVEYGEDVTSMGIVLNHSTGYTLQGLVSEVTREEPVTVYCGGPLSCDRLYYVHTLGSRLIPGARQIAPGLYIGGDFEAMISYVNDGLPIDGRVRFFVGYSGWSSEQLDAEIQQNTWAVTELMSPPGIALTESDDAYWHRHVRAMGKAFRGWLYHPRNPQCN
ncbi:MAG: YqgE/AlgH family protein [Muribaculaceae bacterium]|nr:YqgE/AlgH family protein [Muribaculaceae bacterium]